MTKFKFINFSKVVAKKGKPAALVDIITDGASRWVWMTKDDIEGNIRMFGKCEELEKAYKAYGG